MPEWSVYDWNSVPSRQTGNAGRVHPQAWQTGFQLDSPPSAYQRTASRSYLRQAALSVYFGLQEGKGIWSIPADNSADIPVSFQMFPTTVHKAMLVPTLTILQSVVPAAVVVFVAIGLHCLGPGAVWEVTLVLGVCGTCYRQTDRQTQWDGDGQRD